MCDFRNITKIKLKNGKIVDVHTDKYRPYINSNERKKITRPGLYGFIATGSWKEYFDGKLWLKEGSDWTIIEYEKQNENIYAGSDNKCC